MDEAYVKLEALHAKVSTTSKLGNDRDSETVCLDELIIEKTDALFYWRGLRQPYGNGGGHWFQVGQSGRTQRGPPDLPF